MTRIFIDSNILISAIVFDKNELEFIIRCVSDGDEIYISEHILEESVRVFKDKFPEYLDIFKKFVETGELKIIKKNLYRNKIKEYKNLRDKYDAHVIAGAVAKNCTYIISGDKDLLSYKHKKIKIVRTVEFLKYKRER